MKMKNIKVEIGLYQYDELKEESKIKAFEEHEGFLNSLPVDYENEKGELIEEYIKHDKEAVEYSIRINEYWFFKNGDMADCVTYTGKHEKSGTTEFKFQEKIYLI